MTMTREPHKRPRPELEVQARYVMLSKLAAERRVLDLGGDTKSALLLAEAEVGELTCACPDPRALAADLAEAGVEGVDVVSLPALPLSFDDAAFDLIICHDFGEWLREDPAWISEFRRVLSPGGYLSLAIANPGGHPLSELVGEHFSSRLTYQEAFTELSSHFGKLTLFGQWPMVANLFCDFEEEPDEPSEEFDRSLLSDESEEPGWYLLIFGPETVPHSDRTIVQIPFQSLAAALEDRSATAGSTTSVSGQEMAQLQTERDELVQRVLKLQEDLQESRAAASAAEESPGSAPTLEEREALEERLAAADTELTELRERIRTTEEKLAAAALRASDTAAQLDLSRQNLEVTASRLANAEGQLTGADERLKAAARERDQALATQGEALSTLRQQAGDLSTELESTKAALQEAVEARNQSSAALNDKQTELDGLLRGAKATADEANAKLAADLGEAHSECGALRERLTTLETERDQLQAALDTRESELQAARKEAQTTADRLHADLEAAVQTAQAEAEKSHQAANDAEAAGQRLAEELGAAQTKAEQARSALEGELATLYEDAAGLKERITSIEAERDGLRQTEASEHERAERLQIEMDQAKDSRQDGHPPANADC